jgi:hypothetical protein
MVTADVRPCLSDIIEKFKNNSGCKRKVWFDEDLCDDFSMVGGEGADIAGGRVCQNIDMDSPFSWVFWGCK